MSRYGSAVVNALAQALRPVQIAGLAPQSLFDDIWSFLNTTSAGATALGPDIDSLCKDGGSVGYDSSLAATDGLNFRFKAGVVKVGNGVKSIAAGTILLAASNTNYVEIDGTGSGTVTSNTSGWTTGKARLYLVVTGVATISTVTNAKVLLETPTAGVISGLMLTTAAAMKEISAQLGTISATTSFLIRTPSVAAVLAGITLANSTAVVSDNTNYWSVSLKNKGPAGTGTTDMLNTGAVNSTQTTGGSAIVANVARALALTGTGANLVTAANDVLLLTLTANGSPTALTLVEVGLDFAFTA